MDSTLQRAFGDKEAALEKWKEVKPSVQSARDEEKVAHKMANNLLSEKEKERVASSTKWIALE